MPISPTTAFYLVCAILIVALLVRMWLRSRSASSTASTQPSVTPLAVRSDVTPPPATIAITPAEPVAPQPSAFSNSQSATPTTAAKPIVAAVAGSAPQIAPTSVDSADPYRRPITQVHASSAPSAPLFDVLGRGAAGRDDRLPHVAPAETPLADGSDYLFGGTTPTLAALLPESEDRRLAVSKELRTAGYYQPHSNENFAAIRYLGIVLPLLFFGVLLLVVPPQFERWALAGLIAGPFLGWALPRLFVRGQAQERRTKIERAMPDMLDMLNMCVSQGMTVPVALKRVSDELEHVHPELHKELRIVTEQARIGTLRQALENFSERIDVPEVHSFTSLLTQTDRMGTSVSQALSEYSDNIRESLKQRSDEKGNQAAFKLLFPTVTCLMPAVYMFLLGPSIVELTKFFSREDSNLRQASAIIQQTGRTPNQFQNRGP